MKQFLGHDTDKCGKDPVPSVRLSHLLDQFFPTMILPPLSPPPPEHLEVTVDILVFTLANEDAIGIQWVQIRDASKYSKTHRTAPATKNYLTQRPIVLKLKNPILGTS